MTDYSLKTVNVVVVAVACVVAAVAIVVGAVIANSAADRHRVQMVRACVSAGEQWVRGDCVRTR